MSRLKCQKDYSSKSGFSQTKLLLLLFRAKLGWQVISPHEEGK